MVLSLICGMYIYMYIFKYVCQRITPKQTAKNAFFDPLLRVFIGYSRVLSCKMKYIAPVSDDIEPAAMSFFSYDRFEKEDLEGLLSVYDCITHKADTTHEVRKYETMMGLATAVKSIKKPNIGHRQRVSMPINIPTTGRK